ncbi:MAG: aspartate/glutamate racemase family protein, partial [Planctomycetota bacterium]
AASAVIVAAFGDPGASALSHRLRVPVVGIGTAAAQAAVALGRPFAVATTTPELERPINLLLHQAGGAYLGCFFAVGDPLALLSDQAAFDAGLIGAVRAAAGAGAEQVIIGGGPLADAAERIAEAVPVPLIQPIPEACKAVQALMR